MVSVSRTMRAGSGCSKMLAMVASAWSAGSISDKVHPPARRGRQICPTAAAASDITRIRLRLSWGPICTKMGRILAFRRRIERLSAFGFNSAEHVLIDDVLPDRIAVQHTQDVARRLLAHALDRLDGHTCNMRSHDDVG